MGEYTSVSADDFGNGSNVVGPGKFVQWTLLMAVSLILTVPLPQKS